ncbi:transcriptional regulatory protein DegU [Kordia sp. SMS9]|uniref:response regulator transcription factor n=1 Tax=Kordia sp. SMS9 TaxID=2282170 RepID=UPI000E0DE8EE|nr:response regulator transcription factor [Kordia sp. SMS9]AXG69730.1 transcriptional regulatory protein DegU [Kordia sp. SMS9]
MNEKVIKVGITDDHLLFREGVKLILENFENIEFILEADNGKDLLTKLKNGIPDVVLLDLEMPVMDGIETIKELKANPAYQELKVIILTMHTEERMIAYAMELGANGYITKDAVPSEFELAIRTVYSQDYYFSDHVSQAMLKGLRNKTKKAPKIGADYHLTARETEVLQLIAEGFTTQEIGDKLFLSKRTIEGHRKNLISKLGVRNTASLVVKAVKENLVVVD